MKVLVVAGTASGVGKTTLTLGLIAALRRRGLVVQPFKVGPDYIDPSYHTVAAGRPSRNLDAWMLPEDAVRTLFARARDGADVALVEGVMGLFDGRTGEGDVGSTAHVARVLGAPVVLVLDAAKVARSVAATVLGFARFQPETTVVGCILNNVASERHAQVLRDAIEHDAGVPVLGAIRRDAALRFEERYLGLVPTAERTLSDEQLARLADAIERDVDLERLLSLAVNGWPPAPDVPAALRGASPPVLDHATGDSAPLFPEIAPDVHVRIGVARDTAFNFYYEDNLDLLRAWGAEIVEFSPLADRALPPHVGALYFGGGFPELFAERLATNALMLAAVRDAAERGMPIVAECGGLMYLGRTLTDRDGDVHRMVGSLDVDSSLAKGRLTLGYREVEALRDSPLLRVGERVRGHEFHWSVAADPPPEHAAYRLHADTRSTEGFASPTLLASYVHLHFGADARLAPRFVEAAAAFLSTSTRAGQARRHREECRRRGDAVNNCVILSQAGGVLVPAHRRPVDGINTGVILSQAEPGEGSTDRLPPYGSEMPRSPVPPQAARTGQRGSKHPIRTELADNDPLAPTLRLLRRHGYPPTETEQLSMQRIEERFGDRLPPHEPERSLVARLVYAAGDPSLIDSVRCSASAIEAIVAALRSGARLFVDVRMVAAGLSVGILAKLGVECTVAVDSPDAARIAEREGITRSAAGMLALGSALDGAVVAIGNAPTALLALLDLASERVARPAAVIGCPVGFVAAAESKDALAASDLPHITILGTRGGSALAAAAVNLLARQAAIPCAGSSC